MADVFQYAVVTQKGLALQAKVATGGTIEFTKAKTGAGTVDAVLLQNQTDVSQPVQELLYSAEPTFDDAGRVTLAVVVTNDGLEADYDLYQVGIFAKDPDEGEILYAIIQGSKPVPVSADMAGWSAEFHISVQYGNADTVNVMVDSAGLLTITTADNRYMPLMDYNGAKWSFGRDEKGVYLIEH